MRIIILTALAFPLLAQHPRLILDTTRLTEMRAKVSGSDWTWSDATWGTKAICDGLLSGTVWPLRSLDERYSYNTPYNRYNTASNISSKYQGSGYYEAVQALGACYQANLVDNPTLAATYGTKLAEIAGVLAVTPGKISSSRTISLVTKGTATTFTYSGTALSSREMVEIAGATGDWAAINGVWTATAITSTTFQLLTDTIAFAGSFDGTVARVAYISDSGWQSGTAWQAGTTVSGTQNTSGQMVIAGLVAGGTISAGDVFVVAHGASQYAYIAAANTTANGSGVATVSLCVDCTTNQNTGAYVNMAYRTGGFTDGDSVTREIVLVSGSHGLSTGDSVTVSGVTGNTGANGPFTVTKLDNDHVILQGATMANTPHTNLIWDAGVNAGYGSRYFAPAAAFAYDWGYDLLTSGQRAALRYQMVVWRGMGFKLNTVAFSGNGFGHPMGNYWEGTVNGMFLATLAQEPEDALQTKIYGALRTMFWDAVGAQSVNTWTPSGAADYYSTFATDWYYGDGPYYGNFAVQNILSALFSLKTAKSYDPLTDAHPFTWAPGQFYLHTTLNNRMTGGLRTSLNSSNGGALADRDAHRWNAGTVAMLQSYLRGKGDSFAPYFSSWAVDYYTQAKTLPPTGANKTPAVWPWTTVETVGAFIYYVSSAPATDYKTLNPYYVSTKQPEIVWRKDWTSTGDWFAFNSSPRVNDYTSGKYSYDSGALYIARAGGNLLTNPVNEYFQYGQVAFNYEGGTTSYQPRFANVFQVASTFTPYAQGSYGPGYGPAYDPPANACHSVMPTLTTDVQATYIFAKGSGLEKMYPNAASGDACNATRAVTKWTRKVLQLKNANQTTFVHDVTGIYNSVWDQMMVWSFGGPGTEASAPAGMHRFDIGPGGPATTYLGTGYSIYPASHTTKYGDPRNAAIFTNVITSTFQADASSRLEIRPSGAPAATSWLSMFDLPSAAASAYVPEALSGTAVDAVQINDADKSVVAFPQTEAVPPFTYTFTVGGTVKHYIGGLAASTSYLVTYDGVQHTTSSNAAGLITFSTTGSNTSVAVESTTPVCTIATISPLPAATALSPYSEQLVALGCTGTVTWGATGLPTGLSISAGGLISGTPTAGGSFTVAATATDNGGPVNKNLTLSVLGVGMAWLYGGGFTSNSVIVRYKSPSLASCTVSVSGPPGISSTDFNSHSTQKMIIFSGASESTTYEWSVSCSSGIATASGAFATNPLPQQLTSYPTIAAKAPLSTVATLEISYGSTSSLGSTASEACNPAAGRCSVTLSVANDQILYVQRIWKNGGGSELARSAIEVIAVK